jgi:UDP-glucose 4-epimerase
VSPSGGPRTLLVGGAGFVGASLVRALEARGERPRILDWGQAAGYAYLAGTGAEIVEDDFTDPTTLRGALEGIERVVHLAARTSVPASIASPWEDFQQNVVGTVGLLEACRAVGVQRFVFASSNAAVGLVEPPAREDTAPRPVAPYGAAKLAAEGYLHAYYRSYGLVTTALRFANAYGPYSLHKISVVAAMTKAYLRGEPITIYGDGSQTRDFVHVDDLVRLVLLVLDAPTERVAGEIFQAGTGVETPVLELATTLIAAGQAAGGPQGTIRHEPPRNGDVPRNVSDVAKAERVVRYRPTVRLEEGLGPTVRWFRDALADPALASVASASAMSGSD